MRMLPTGKIEIRWKNAGVFISAKTVHTPVKLIIY